MQFPFEKYFSIPLRAALCSWSSMYGVVAPITQSGSFHSSFHAMWKTNTARKMFVYASFNLARNRKHRVSTGFWFPRSRYTRSGEVTLDNMRSGLAMILNISNLEWQNYSCADPGHSQTLFLLISCAFLVIARFSSPHGRQLGLPGWWTRIPAEWSTILLRRGFDSRGR